MPCGSLLSAVGRSGRSDDDRADLAAARQGFRDVYSDAQMILPDRVLNAAIEVSSALGDAYGMIKRLENGELRAASAGGLPRQSTPLASTAGRDSTN